MEIHFADTLPKIPANYFQLSEVGSGDGSVLSCSHVKIVCQNNHSFISIFLHLKMSKLTFLK